MRDAETETQRGLLGMLLFQLADDDLVVAERNAEWLGLAPHLEEDIAWSSIAQDEMGHAATYYSLLEDLGFGSRDQLAQLRPATARRNSVLVERPNGLGTYLNAPRFDWAYAIARHYLYDTFEDVRLSHVVDSCYEPLARVATKIRREERYHQAHSQMWMAELLSQPREVRQRVEQGLRTAMADAGDLAYTATWATAWETQEILPGASTLLVEWQARVAQDLNAWELEPPRLGLAMNGRRGEHSQDLVTLLAQVSAVLKVDPVASW